MDVKRTMERIIKSNSLYRVFHRRDPSEILKMLDNIRIYEETHPGTVINARRLMSDFERNMSVNIEDYIKK